MTEEEDSVLLNSLGVTSANPEDIERRILEKATSDARNDKHAAALSAEKGTEDGSQDINPITASKKELYRKLRVVEIEIDAVASAVEQTENAVKFQKCDSDGNQVEGTEEDKGTIDSVYHDTTLQHALAADRLRSLKKTRAQLRKELSDLSKDSPTSVVDEGKLLLSLVRDDSKSKRKLKQPHGSGEQSKKKRKTYSIDDDGDFDAVLHAASGGFTETERDKLIRKGILTPFHKLKGFERPVQQAGPSNTPNEEKDLDESASASASKIARALQQAAQARPTTKLLNPQDLPKLCPPPQPFRLLRAPFKVPGTVNNEEENTKGMKRKRQRQRPLPGKKWRKRVSRSDSGMEEAESVPDDLLIHGCEEETEEVVVEDENEPPFVMLDGGLKIPETIFSKLFDYQKVGVQWLWELHCQGAGGIIGDEMGLGKTVQVLAFLGALHYSGLYKPSIIICPVTLLRQWQREAQIWYPAFHTEVLHDSVSDHARRKKKAESDGSEIESESQESPDSDDGVKEKSSQNLRKWDSLLKRVLMFDSGLLITTYDQLRILGETLLDVEWGYAVLDEGHKIKNPNADITIVCKQLQTVHRIIMTGSPIQNKLTELWSLFDFVFPGKLGVLPVFEAEFSVPITVGGYVNASPLQVSTAYRCAVVLRDLILPYLLRRMKVDVNAQLPNKTEHVLFCSLTPEQRSRYRAFLASSDVEQILEGNKKSLFGIDVMRKICNHPDLLEREHSSSNQDYGNPERSGKMKVLAEVLKMWKEQGHRVLLFAQTQQMLDILENFLAANGYSYRRMDGSTHVNLRMALIDEFNNSNEVFIFILTTKVGGLGTNLTGANRVIIFDPDWNPSTDMQARERAWRIGQKRDVTVYRLITRGTIEEKVYHRQIYKQYLNNKILKNPQQKRVFSARDLKDLFILNEDGDAQSTETSSLFGQISAEVNVVGANDGHQQSPGVPSQLTAHANGSNCNNGELPSSEAKEEADQNGKEADEDTFFLKSLFEAHGIHSAVNHDVIMDVADDDKIRLEQQASQVAQRAAEALRQSRMLCSRESVSVPTWTGKSGAAGGPPAVRRKFGSTMNTQLIRSNGASGAGFRNGGGFGNSRISIGVIGAGSSSGKVLSSSELLAKIKGNQASAISDGLEHQLGQSSVSTASDGAGPARRSQNQNGGSPEVLVRQICTFIQQRGGRTNTASIVDHFKDRVSADELTLFKNLLKEITTLETGLDGKYWVLKPEYQ